MATRLTSSWVPMFQARLCQLDRLGPGESIWGNPWGNPVTFLDLLSSAFSIHDIPG